jgi:hypothetical protein
MNTDRNSLLVNTREPGRLARSGRELQASFYFDLHSEIWETTRDRFETDQPLAWLQYVLDSPGDYTDFTDLLAVRIIRHYISQHALWQIRVANRKRVAECEAASKAA